MEEKITLNLFYMGLISAILAVLCAGIAFFEAFQTQVEDDLQRESSIICAAYESMNTPQDLSSLPVGDLRITLVEPDGDILYESEADSQAMTNHLNRPEIQEALKTGVGSSHRISETLEREDYYYAKMLSDGNVLRISCSSSSIFQIYGSVIPYLVLAVCALMAIAVALAIFLTRRLLKPIKSLPDQLEDPDFRPDKKSMYPELIPFVEEIKKHRDERDGMRQEFTANVSHELKTPLTSISGYAELIESGLAKEEDVRRFAGTIRKEAARLLSLISDIIRLSQLDEDESPVAETPVDLYSLATECMESLGQNAGKKGVALSVEGESLVVTGEEANLWELVYNLMDNAIRYNRPNCMVTVTLKDRTLSVSDTGIGIPQEHQTRIFERFYRVDKSHSRATGGTGLGLSIVKHVAERHNARISIESTPGVGTTMSVTFPE